MTEKEVIELMQSSKSEKEWNANCDLVRSRCNGYPSFWYSTIILSNIMDRTVASWNSDASIRIEK